MSLAFFGSAKMPAQAVREVVLAPEAGIHSVSVRGWPGMITAIRLPDSFAFDNVLCADCFDLEASVEGRAAGDKPEAGERNWILERRPKERTLFLRPARLPSVDNPAAGFATNIVITLDGGALINLQVSLPRLNSNTHTSSDPTTQSDAVVTLRYPGQAPHSGRLVAEKEKLIQEFLARTEEVKREWAAQFLSGDIDCKSLLYGTTSRHQNVSLRIKKLCSSRGAKHRNYWVQYRVENRAVLPMRIVGDVLEANNPESVSALNSLPTGAHCSLDFGDAFEGVAIFEADAKRALPSALQMRIELTGRESVSLRVGDLKL